MLSNVSHIVLCKEVWVFELARVEPTWLLVVLFLEQLLYRGHSILQNEIVNLLSNQELGVRFMCAAST